MYGKSDKKIENFHLKNLITLHQITFWGQKWAHTLVSWPSTNARFKFLIFWFFAKIWPFLWSKNAKIQFLDHKKGHILAKNRKIKNLNLPFVEGHETKVWAHFWPQKVIWCWVINFFRENFSIFFSDFSRFSIHFREKVRVGANFDASYLGNPRELWGKWAHFGSSITRATTLYPPFTPVFYPQNTPPIALRPML